MENIKICLIDDSSDELFRLRDCLSRAKNSTYEILEASCGREAIQVISNNQNLDIVILDFTMPDMNGIEVLSELEKMGIRPRTIMLTSEVQSEYANQMNVNSIVAWLVKPFNEDRFLDLLPRAMKKTIS